MKTPTMHKAVAVVLLPLWACGLAGVRTDAVQQAEVPGLAPYPRLATADTLADAQALAELEKPGRVLFEDGFESPASLARYFEVRGAKNGRASVTDDPQLAHSGRGALQLISPESGGDAAGAGVSGWLGDAGYERVYLRYYLKFAADYDQGNLNHTGGGLVGVAGTNKWRGMGSAGLRPAGDDHFSSAFETWRDWGRVAAPGWGHLYTYWMDMKRDRDGHWWGNMMAPEPVRRVVPARDAWTCFELMIRCNTPGASDGELAAWIDGRLYVHFVDFRWRSDAGVLLKRFGLDVYVHKAERTNEVWYDDLVVSTGYVGPLR